jgi:hypothetical protein
MAITRTTRLSLHRWDSGADPFNRAQADADNLQIETLTAMFRAGLDANKGSASAAANARSFYLSTDTSPVTLYYSDGTNWVTTNLTGTVSDIQPLTMGAASSAGTSTTTGGVTTQKYALADHVHALPAAAVPSSIGTTLSAGAATSLTRSDHVHNIGTGAINASTMFAAGVVNAAAIGTDAVTTGKILNANVTTDKIADNAVTAAKIPDGGITGAKIAAAVAGSGINQNATTKALEAKVDGQTIGINASGQIYLVSTGSASSIPDNSITTAKIVDGAVTTAKIAALAVTAAKIASDVAGAAHSKNGTTGALDVVVDNSTIEINTNALRIKDLGVTPAKLATSVVGSGLQQNATSKALEAKVDGQTIGINASGQIYLVSTGNVGSIPDNSITAAKLADDTAGLGLVRNATSKALDVNTDASTLEVVSDIVRIKDLGVTAAKLAANAVSTAKLDQTAGSQAVTTATIRDLNVTTAKIADLNVTTAKIADTNVTAAKINADVAGNGLVKNATSGVLDVNVDGTTLEIATDTVRVKTAGILTANLADSSVTNAKIAATAIDSTKIQDGSVVTAKIADAGVTTAKLADGNVSTAKLAALAVTTSTIAAGAVTTAKLDTTALSEAVTTATIRDGNVTTAKIADGAVTIAKHADSSVTTAKIADGNVTTAKIGDGAVTAGKVADANITTAKIADGNVTTAKIASSAVDNAKIADGAVSYAKVAAGAIDRTKMASASMVVIACTSGTRPASPAIGQAIWETDTSRLRVWNGAVWALQNGLLGADFSGTATLATNVTAAMPSTAGYNPDGLWNTSTAVFTSPEDANYHIQVRFSSFSGNPAAGFGSNLQIAFSAMNADYASPIFNVTNFTATFYAPMPQNSTLTFRIFNATGATVTYNYTVNVRHMGR